MSASYPVGNDSSPAGEGSSLGRLDGQDVDTEDKSPTAELKRQLGAALSERDSAELSLQKVEAQHRALISAIPDMIFTNRRDGLFVAVHTADSSMLIATPTAFLNRPIGDILPKPVAEKLVRSFAKALDCGEVQEVTYHLDIDGKDRFFEARIVPSSDDCVVSIVRDITAIKHAVAALRDSEDRYRTLVEWAPDPIGVHQDGVIVYANPAAVRLFGAQSAQDLIGTRVEDRIHPNSLKTQLERKRRADEGDTLQMIEQQFLTLDGAMLDVEVLGTSIAFGGRPAILTIMRDISERKRTKAALQDSEQRYRSMIEWIPDSVIVHRNGSIVYVNPSAVRMLGHESEQELLGTELIELIHPDDRELHQLRVRDRALGTPIPSTIEFRLIRTDDSTIYTEVRSTELEFHGEFARLSLVRDITGRKHAEAKLRESDARIRKVLDKALDAVIEIDSDGRITHWNARAETLFGWTRSEAMGQALDDLIVPPEHREAHRQGLKRFLVSGTQTMTGKRVETTAIHRSGARLPVEMSIVALTSGGKHHFTAFIADIAERKRMVEAMENAANEKLAAVAARIAALDEADAAQKLRETFTNVVAHELRTPMQTLSTAADLIEMALNCDGDVKTMVGTAIERIRYAVDMMSVQLRDISEYSRSANPQMSIRCEPFSATALAKRVDEAFKGAAAAKGLLYTVTTVPESPPKLAGDLMRLSQVVNNLVDNSIKYTDKGAVQVTISVDATGLSIEVADDGIGIEEGDLVSVLQPFTRGQNVPISIAGKGLGLPVVDKIVQAMGGTFTIMPNSPVGTIARVRAPLRQANQGGTKILVVDDRLADEFVSMLNQIPGCQPLSATSGHQGIEMALQNSDIALILLDIQLPDMSGMAVAKTIRARLGDSTPPIVAITAFAGSIQDYERHVFQEILEKPIHMRDIQRLRHMFTKRHA